MDDFKREYEKYGKSSTLESFLFLLFFAIMILGIINISNGALITMKYLLLASLAYELSLYKGIDLEKRRSLWEHVKSAVLKNIMLLIFLIAVWIYNVVFGSNELAFEFGFASYFYAQVVYSFSKDEDCVVTLIGLFIAQVLLLAMFLCTGTGVVFHPLMMLFL